MARTTVKGKIKPRKIKKAAKAGVISAKKGGRRPSGFGQGRAGTVSTKVGGTIKPKKKKVKRG